MKWTDALKIWNNRKAGHQGEMWCVPKKGTEQHADVMRIMRKDNVPSTIIDERGTLRPARDILEAYDTKKQQKRTARFNAQRARSGLNQDKQRSMAKEQALKNERTMAKEQALKNAKRKLY